MDKSTAIALNEMNKRFYAAKAGEFSATRNNSWRGWRLALEAAGLLGVGCDGVVADARSGGVAAMVEKSTFGVVGALGACVPGAAETAAMVGALDAPVALNVLDVACGNLRFEAWMGEVLPGCDLRFVAVDACRELLPALPANVRFEECDIVTRLLEGEAAVPVGERFDLVVSFGFMHHVPGVEARAVLLDELLAATRPGGHAVVSYWRFADDEGLRARAEQSTGDALSWGDMDNLSLDEGDYLLGFGEESAELRYCHSFSDNDIDAVLGAAKIPFDLVARYRADGRTNALNEYVVLRRR